MSEFFTNLAIRTEDQERVIDWLREHGNGDCYVSPVEGGWVTVFDLVSETQVDDPMDELGIGLSQELETSAIGLTMNDGRCWYYNLYRHGELSDEYISDPTYEGYEGDEAEAYRGKPERLVECLGGEPEALKQAVAAGDLDAFAAALGLPHSRLGYNRIDMGDVDLALRDGFEHIEMHHDDEELSLDVDELARLVGESPDDIELRFMYATVLWQGEQNEEAAAQFRRLIELAPEDPVHHDGLGLALADLGNKPEALDSFRRASELDPDSFEYHLHAAEAALDLELLEEALAAAREADSLCRAAVDDPSETGQEEEQAIAYVAYTLGRIHRAWSERCFTRAREEEPSLVVEIASFHREAGRLSEAQALLEDYLSNEDPEDGPAIIELAFIILEAGDEDRARGLIRAGLIDGSLYYEELEGIDELAGILAHETILEFRSDKG